MRTWAWWALLAVPLAACSTDTTDFEHSAEHYIGSDAMAAQAGTTFNAASCDRPASTRPGTTYTCTATDARGTEWTFEVVIVDGSNFQITGHAR
jgi:hypothetical protein